MDRIRPHACSSISSLFAQDLWDEEFVRCRKDSVTSKKTIRDVFDQVVEALITRDMPRLYKYAEN